MPCTARPSRRGLASKIPITSEADTVKVIVRQCLTKIAGTDDDHILDGVQSEDLTDFFKEIFDVITVALLPESTEIVKVLADL